MKIIEPDPERAPLIARLFELYDSGEWSVSRLADFAYAQGLRTRKGNKVQTASLHRMLHNPIYRGVFNWNGQEYKGIHKPIVSSTLWYAVQDRLAGRNKRKTRTNSKGYAYTGLIRCGVCGCAITAETKKGKYVYYHCTGWKGKHKAPWLREKALDGLFAGILDRLDVDGRVIRLDSGYTALRGA